MEITKREVLASISIIAVLLLIGILISGHISDSITDSNQVYYKALKIEDNPDVFDYSMRTNVGNAFVYGTLSPVDTVGYDDIDGEYLTCSWVKERYTQHTRQVAHVRKVGKTTQTYYTTETYWTWDMVDSDSKSCKEISFCGTVFPVSKIDLPSDSHIDTIKESSHIRYKYYGLEAKDYKGSIFVDLRDGTIPDNTKFMNDCTISEYLESLENSGTGAIVGFWLLWIVLIIVCVYGFYYLDNWWLV